MNNCFFVITYMLSYDGNPDVLFFSHEPTWPFIKNSNQVHVHFLPYFYNSRIGFITKLDKVTSIIFK